MSSISLDEICIDHQVLSHPDIEAIAAKYGKSTANVVLRWHLQMEGTMVCKVGQSLKCIFWLLLCYK